MVIATAREFRANQGKYLSASKRGEEVILTSRYGDFKIVPIVEDDSLTARICRGLREVKLIREGKLKAKSIEDLLNGL